MNQKTELPAGITSHILQFLPTSTTTKPLEHPPALVKSDDSGSDKDYGVNNTLTPGEVTALTQGCGFFFRDGLLGSDESTTLARAVKDVKGLRQARTGASSVTSVDENTRGDSIVWITEQWDNTTDQNPFRQLFSKVKSLFNELDIDLAQTSVQLARYEGNGAKYVLHRDTNVVDASQACAGKLYRKYTVIYYLNKGWQDEDGGHLVFEQQWKVKPVVDRLFCFDSTKLHEVLPCFKERWAITMWLYGKVHPLRSIANNTNETLFVAIPSFRDPECGQTIRSLFENAEFPDLITVGVYLQVSVAEDSSDCYSFPQLTFEQARRVKYTIVDSSCAAGPNFARHEVQKLFNDETYVLNIDSHTRVIKHWDTILKRMLNSIPSSKPILTTYPSSYERGSTEATIVKERLLLEHAGALEMYALKFDNDNMLRLASRRTSEKLTVPKLGKFWAAGFNFSRAQVLTEVPYLPIEDLFFGEEALMTARLWTHGFDFYTPTRDIVFHLWTREYRKTFAPRSTKRKKALKYVHDVLQGRREEDIGKHRTLKEYEQFAGVDFINFSID